MTISRMFSDLQRNADDRLETWAKDTAMRCHAGGLEEAEALSMVVSVLLGRVTSMLKNLGMGREDFLILVQGVYDGVPRSEIRKNRGIFENKS